MDYADKLDFMDDDCDIEGYPLNMCSTCKYHIDDICYCENSDNRFEKTAIISCEHHRLLRED